MLVKKWLETGYKLASFAIPIDIAETSVAQTEKNLNSYNTGQILDSN